MSTIKTLVFLLLGFILFLTIMHFLSLNEQVVVISTGFGALPKASIGKVILISFVFGGLLGLLCGFLPSTLDKMLITRLRVQLKKAQQLSADTPSVTSEKSVTTPLTVSSPK
jgi:uncharacterized integral membrane protein